MADYMLIPIAGHGLLALDRETFENGLARGAELVATPMHANMNAAPEPLLNADSAAEQLGVTARWLADSARAGIVPHFKLARFIRFRVSDIAAHFRVDGGPVQTDSQSDMQFRQFATKLTQR